ncbi:MAG: hypothetical protein ACR5LC_04845 [Symbiopectobacterium sp.]|uniref:hypothetical protein n=1 Tax=Symbiopectobacterium sp. TaxID=2952789 RepID=UPI003F34D31A
MSVNEVKLSRSDSGLIAVIATSAKRLWLLGVLVLTTIVIFMTIELGSNLQYILVHRGLMLATMRSSIQ